MLQAKIRNAAQRPRRRLRSPLQDGQKRAIGTTPACVLTAAVAMAMFSGAAHATPPLPDRPPQRTTASPTTGHTPVSAPTPALPVRATRVAAKEGAGRATNAPPRQTDLMTPAERRFRADVSRRATPLIPAAPDRATHKAIITALISVRKRDITAARTAQAQIADPVARTLIDWAALRVGFGTPDDVLAFLDRHPDWPDGRLLRKRMEQGFFNTGGDVTRIRSTFAKWPPVTSVGLAVLASSHLATGDQDKARALAGDAWCRTDLPSSYEDDFLRRLGDLLREADHKCRLDVLLTNHVRNRSSRAALARRIRPVIAKLSAHEKAVYTARLSMFLRQRAAPKFIRAVPDARRQSDAGFVFQYAGYLRRRNRDATAWKALTRIPANAPGLVNRDAWWAERRLHALEALRLGKPRKAYELVAKVRPEDVNKAKDQAFFAGWLALKHLKAPRKAVRHFLRQKTLADGPLSLSKAEYWLAVAYRRTGQQAKAAEHFKAAAGIRDTFHGLLAREELQGSDRTLALPLPSMPTPQDVATLKSSTVLHAAILTQRLGLDRLRYTLRFFGQLGTQLKTAGQFVLAAQIARELGDGQVEVRFGKMGVARGFETYLHAYPVDLLPSYAPLRPPVEKAMLLGIARQESEFDTAIVSRAGARGVLQVMPITARHVCRQYRIKCNIAKLLQDPVYNARLGSAYIADRKEDFGGSYILTLTGYNAGPGRTRQWLRRFGDPRSREMQPLDWIYRIPFDETRAYVQKVLSNVQVYRARLGLRQPLRLVADMRRGRL